VPAVLRVDTATTRKKISSVFADSESENVNGTRRERDEQLEAEGRRDSQLLALAGELYASPKAVA
jgi:hypothetical protein